MQWNPDGNRNRDSYPNGNRSTHYANHLFGQQCKPDSQRSDDLQLEPCDRLKQCQYREPDSQPAGNDQLYRNRHHRNLFEYSSSGSNRKPNANSNIEPDISDPMFRGKHQHNRERSNDL
jgi:hypothetical protein